MVLSELSLVTWSLLDGLLSGYDSVHSNSEFDEQNAGFCDVTCLS